MRAAHVHEVELELDPGRRRERLRQLSPSSARRSSIHPIEAGIYPLAEVSTPRAHRHRRRAGPRLAARARSCAAAAPEPARGADLDPGRGRPEAGRGGGRDRDRDDRRPAWHVPHGHRDRAERARGRRPADRRAGDGDGRRALGAGAPDPPSQPAPRRGGGRRRQRADEGRLVQPGLPRRAPAPRDAAAAQRQARPVRLPGRRPTRSSPAASGRRRGCTRPGSSPFTTRPASSRRKRLREWIWQAVERAGDAIESLPAELRARRGLGAEADALRCAHFPGVARAGRRGARPARLRGALPAPGGARRPPRRAPRLAPGDRLRAARASWSRAGSRRCRSSRPPASGARSRRSTPTSPAGGRCSGC